MVIRGRAAFGLALAMLGCTVPELDYRGRQCATATSCGNGLICFEQQCATERAAEDFEDFAPTASWVDGARYGRWELVYNGFGEAGIELDGSQVLTLAPRASTSPGDSQAALALWNEQLSDLDFAVRVKWVASLRTGSPPAEGEVPWVYWRYVDDEHTYAFSLQTHGWELAKLAGNAGMVTLAEGNEVIASRGVWRRVRVRMVGEVINVWVDGRALATVRDSDYAAGRVGLYAEDAHGHFDDLVFVEP